MCKRFEQLLHQKNILKTAKKAHEKMFIDTGPYMEIQVKSRTRQ